MEWIVTFQYTGFIPADDPYSWKVNRFTSSKDCNEWLSRWQDNEKILNLHVYVLYKGEIGATQLFKRERPVKTELVWELE